MVTFVVVAVIIVSFYPLYLKFIVSFYPVYFYEVY